MMQLSGHIPQMSYANSTQLARTAPRGTVNDEEPTPPASLTAAEAYRWKTGHRHLTAANHTDINTLDPAGRARHWARLRATLDDLLHLTEELSQRPNTRPDGNSDVL